MLLAFSSMKAYITHKMFTPYLHEHLSNDHVIVILKHGAEDYGDSVLFRLNIPGGSETHESVYRTTTGFCQ